MTADRTSAVCVVIPTWNGWPMLSRCLEALRQQTCQPAQIVVVDNGSADGTAERVRREHPSVTLVELPANEGFAGGCNRGIEAARDELDIVLLNNDALPEPTWLERLVTAAAEHADAGILSAKLLDEDGLIESTGDFLDRWGVPYQRGRGEPDRGQYDGLTQIFAGCGGAALYRRTLLEDVGAFDESFFAYYEDVDLSFRARLAGWEVLLVPDAVVRHRGGGTSLAIPGFRRFHATRNLWFLTIKNVPGVMLPGALVRALLVQALWFAGALRHRQVGVSLRAHAAALRALPSMWAERRRVQSRRRVPVRVVRGWL